MAKVKPLKWIYETSKKQHLSLVVLVLANAVFSILSILFAFAIKGVIDGAVKHSQGKLLSYAVFIGTIVVLQFFGRIIINGLTERIRGKLEIVYKSHLFSQILTKKQEKISTYHSGDLMNRLTSDVSVVCDGITSIVPTIVAAATRLICAIVALVVLDWIFAIAFSVAGVLVFIVLALVRGKLKSLHKTTQETDGKVRSFMQECIENLLAVKVFSNGGRVEDKSNRLQKDNFKVKMKRKNYSVVGNALYNFIFSAGYLFALIYGAIKLIYLSSDPVMGYGTLSAILQLVNNVQVPFATLSNIFPKYYSMVASAERLIEIEQVESEGDKPLVNGKQVYSKLKGIVLDDLSFAYDRDVVIKNANFYIEKGDCLFVHGASGIGKSTLIKLLLGVYLPNSGRIYLDLDQGQVDLDYSTRSLFAYVPQGNMLFSGTIKDNVTFINDNADREEIKRALEIACADEFINELPEKLGTIVGENGVGLSEGQVQRIAIARAILTGAPILLLDEATSALDEDTEKRVLDNLKELKDITLVIVSHKKAAQRICNKKIKIKDKKVIFEQ